MLSATAQHHFRSLRKDVAVFVRDRGYYTSKLNSLESDLEEERRANLERQDKERAKKDASHKHHQEQIVTALVTHAGVTLLSGDAIRLSPSRAVLLGRR